MNDKNEVLEPCKAQLCFMKMLKKKTKTER